jgi:ATP-dependent Clp protease ATP-binding subunit ClpA
LIYLVQAFLTDEGYDPIYGARPLRRAIMKYLEDTLAEQCLSKTLYPNTKIHVRRKKVEGTLMTYTNDIEVEVDFSDVDPNLLFMPRFYNNSNLIKFIFF